MTPTYCDVPGIDPRECQWKGWNKKAMYITTKIDPSVVHHQAVGEAIHRWNQAVGARFLMIPGEGDAQIEFYEKTSLEWPFNENQNTVEGKRINGLTFRDTVPVPGPGDPPNEEAHRLVKARIYIRKDAPWKQHQEWVHGFAHELGHPFGLADYREENKDSVMSYKRKGKSLLGPSNDDLSAIAACYGLNDLKVRQEDLDGIEHVDELFTLDRYGGTGWHTWTPHGSDKPIDHMEPYEVYFVKGNLNKEFELSFGRVLGIVFANRRQTRWVYQ